MRIRAISILLSLCLILTACGGAKDTPSPVEMFREPFQTMSSCSAEAVVTCTQYDGEWSATIHCDYVPDGESHLAVIAPETIAGVQATLSDTDWTITYADVCLNAGLLSSQELSPIACLPQLLRGLREGWLLEENFEDCDGISCLRLTFDQTGTQNGKLVSTLWLKQEDGMPVRGEISVEGERILTAVFTAFSFADL